jgi:hypothetical protein
VTLGYTLSVSISSWLVTSERNKTTGSLPIGAEVTVYGELAGEVINMDSLWAVITNDSEAGEGIYKVTDAQGETHEICRLLLRHRKRHSIATGHVTDDKIHDRHAMQHFTTHELDYLEAYMKVNFPQDIPEGNIVCLHQHSDNVSTHFKNTGAINYFTTLIGVRGGPSKTAFVYSFGAPGHGKGPFDGIGGRWKNKINQAMSTAERKKLEFTDTGYSEKVKDVFKALDSYFGQSMEKDSQLAEKNNRTLQYFSII